tara:strand:- start:1709 stop:1999 length:291 start_codon:yes stop_codon:yes gene_type:complete
MAIVLGLLAGAGYFVISESSVPKESNCSYLAPASTDYLAWIAGAFLAWRGSKLKDPIVTIIGMSVTSLHMAQWGAHKAMFGRRSQYQIDNPYRMHV